MVELLFTTSTIWTVPKDWTNENIIEVYGGGGGCTSWFTGGGAFRNIRPGYAGGYNYAFNTSQLRPGDRVSIAVGSGGSGGIGEGFLRTTIIQGYRYNYFDNFNFVGQYGGNSDITNLDRGVGTIISASRGGPGVAEWSNYVSGPPYTIYQYYPAQPQTMPGQPNPGRAGNVNNWIRYTPIFNGLIIKRPEAGMAGLGGASINQSGFAGVVAISYTSTTTHSPCVWIS